MMMRMRMEKKPEIRVGGLVKLKCLDDVIFPIRGVYPDLLSLEAACGHPSDTIWGIQGSKGDEFLGMVVRIIEKRARWYEQLPGINVVYEVLLAEEIVSLDREVMATEPYNSVVDSWIIVPVWTLYEL